MLPWFHDNMKKKCDFFPIPYLNPYLSPLPLIKIRSFDQTAFDFHPTSFANINIYITNINNILKNISVKNFTFPIPLPKYALWAATAADP